ncbi:MAG: hypothetical protein OQJ89_11045, partial [Kangiellaceae bacterium]|nr:hypothetical protein [Kangiellaceae bacterium]
GDGVIDVRPENNSFWSYDSIRVVSDVALQLDTMYVNETEAYQPVELRITVIDELGENIEGVEFFASDLYQGRLETTFDSDTNEYIFNYQSSSGVDLNMPSFTTADDITYQSASIDLNWASENTLSISDWGFRNNLPGSIDVVNGVASITVQPRVGSTTGNYIDRVSSAINENANFSLNQFYQAPIALTDNSVELERRNVFKVIKGNESSNDLVAEGTTQIGRVSENVEVTAELSHNDTFLVASPDTQLTGGDYTYRVNQLANPQTGNEFNSNYATNFSVPVGSTEVPVFNINDLRLDNNNGTTNGSVIVAANTAGIANNTTDNNSSASLYFPRSILSLDFFELNRVSFVRDGNNYINDDQIRVVNGDSVYVNQIQLISLANNENIERIPGAGYVSAHYFTALTDGEWYYSNSSVYLGDNTNAQINTVTFSYLYRVKGEDTVHEGTITLSVR